MKYLAECELVVNESGWDYIVNTNTKSKIPYRHYMGYTEDGDGVIVVCGSTDPFNEFLDYTVIKLKDMSEIDYARIKLKLYV